MTRADLLALAARVEAAQAKDEQQILLQVFDALHLPAAKHYRAVRMIEAEGYESAAASLVPEGWTGTIHLDGKAGLYRDDMQPALTGIAATPALALTAAALRAMAEEATDGPD